MRTEGAFQEQFKSPSGKRLHPRVRLPLVVELADQQVATADWSLGGFTLERPLAAAQVGDVIDVALRFGSFDAAVCLRGLKAEVVRCGPGINTAFKFLALSDEQQRLMERLIADHLSGQLRSFEDLMTQRNGLLKHTKVATPVSAATARGRLRIFGVAGVLALLIALCGWLLQRSLLSVHSAYATAILPLVSLAAPVTGIVTFASVDEGRPVSAGDLLFSVAPTGANNEFDQLVVTRTMLMGKRAVLEQQLREAQTYIGSLKTSYQQRGRALDRRTEALDDEIALRLATVSRVAELAKKGYVPAVLYDEERIALARLERQKAELQDERARLDSETRLAAAGIATDSLTDTSSTPGRLGEDIDRLDAELRAVDATLVRVERRHAVISPCDCTVQRLLLDNQVVASAATPVILLRRHGQRPMVRALVPSSRAQRLSVGTPATVRFSNGLRIDDAKVRRVSFDLQAADWAAAAVPRNELMGMAEVEIGFKQSLAEDLHGVSAAVRFQPALWDQLGAL